MFQQENRGQALCRDMHAPAILKVPCFSHTNLSDLSVLTLGWPSCLFCSMCWAVKTTEPGPEFAGCSCPLHTTPARLNPSFQPELQYGAGRLAGKVWLHGRCAFKKCPAPERSSKSWREIRDITGRAMLGSRAVRHTHQTGTDFFQIHFQTQVTWILIKTNTV